MGEEKINTGYEGWTWRTETTWCWEDNIKIDLKLIHFTAAHFK